MRRHLDLLGTLYLIWGALCLVLSLAMLALGLAALAIFASTGAGEPGVRLTASFLSGLFLSLAALGLLWGCVHLWSASALYRGREWGRAVAMFLGIINLLLLPFGTALGAYAVWVLTRRDIPPPVASREA
jgi:hypothetical protein